MLKKWTLVITLIFGITIVVAQEEAAVTCNAAIAQTDLTALIEGLTTAEEIGAALREIRNTAGDYAIACDGLVFTSEAEGIDAVFTADIPEGFYAMHFETQSVAGGLIQSLEGDCRPETFSVSENDGGKTEASFQAREDCHVAIEINSVSGWTLNFEVIE